MIGGIVDKMKSNKIRYYHCDERMMNDILNHSKDGWRTKIIDFPDDAYIERVIPCYETYGAGVYLVVSSDSFNELRVGDAVPIEYFKLYREEVGVIG